MPNSRKYVMVGDRGVDYGWVVDWDRYSAIPWWKRGFARNRCIQTGGKRQEMRDLAAKMNADPEKALTILDEWKSAHDV